MTSAARAMACLFALLASVASAQVPGDLGSRFARATITENAKPLLMGTIFEDSADNLIVMGAPLASVIARAYGVEPYQVIDAPEWVYQAHRYDIDAVPPPAELVQADEAAMLQALLADRFGLQARRGMREVTMLVLDVAHEKQRELAQQAPRYASIREAERAGVRPDASIGVGTQSVLSGLARMAREPILDVTESGGVVYIASGRRVLGIPPEPFARTVELLAQSGVIVERRSVSLEVLVVTKIEHPVLDAIDR